MDELDGGSIGSVEWMKSLQQLSDDVEALLADQLAEKWQRMVGEPRSDWAAVVQREYTESDLAEWRERLAESYARPVSQEERDAFRLAEQKEYDSRLPQNTPNTHYPG